MKSDKEQVDELLRPRYKVIADYPNMEYWFVGEIITFREDKVWEYIKEIVDCQGSHTWLPKWFDKYPHIFKKLDWWEDRELDSLPQFTKYVNANTNELLVCKVDKWQILSGGQLRAFTKDHGLGYYYMGDIESPTIDSPATEEEYLNQQK